MNTSELHYEGDLRTRATHIYSGTNIFTDAPLDNNGKAESFSPTDLVATALGCCMVTVMGIEAVKMSLDIKGVRVSVKKVMALNPRRISKVQLRMEIPGDAIPAGQRATLEQVAINCPVAKSLHADIAQEIEFVYV